MELYEYARPELYDGRKILYLHGFASSGQNGAVKTMRLLLPGATVLAPDLPVEPDEVLPMVYELLEREKPELVIGTSMGGMFAEMLYGYDRIIVNPALHLADTLLKNNGLGRQDFHSPRADGATSFFVTKGMLERFREISSHCFEGLAEAGVDEQEHVYGMFGTRDSMVDCFGEFSGHYRNSLKFDGEHYLNDAVFLHSVLPVMQWMDDRRVQREKRSILITLDDVLRDSRNGQPVGECVKTVSALARYYDVYFAGRGDHCDGGARKADTDWLDRWIGVPAWNRVISGNHKELLLGDYLIDAHPEECGGDGFMGTLLHFGREPFRSWQEIREFFERLGGQ